MANNHYIPPETIDEIRTSNNIVDVISECGVQLKQAGRNYQALCPFHDEKTPSFSVSPERQIFHCFGCKTGGNVISFVQKHEGKSFIETIKWLAERANISLPERDSKSNERQQHINRLSELNRFAIRYYHELLRTGQYSQQAREYLKNRGVNSQTINHFQLGYAKQQRQDLVKAAKHEGYTIQQLLDVGLIKNEGLGPQDRFWNRILFPIHNAQGNPVGFGGRSLSEEHQPKYLNSPGTVLYDKSKILYNLDKARQSISRKRSALLVEGYMDVLMLHQHGIENVIASSGTSLSQQHASLLSRYTPEVVIVFDGDNSGLQAAQRGLHCLVGEGIRVRIALVPEGDDPDSFVKEHGTDEFDKLIDKAINIIEFQIQSAIHENNIRNPEVKTQVLKDTCEVLVNIQNRVERAEYVKYAIKELDVDEGLIWRELRELGLKDTPIPRQGTQQKINQKKLSPREKIELQFVQSLIQAPEHIHYVRQEFDINDIQDPILAKITQILCDAAESNEEVDIQQVLNTIDDEKLSGFITNALLNKKDIPNYHTRIQGCIVKLKAYLIQDIEQQVRKASQPSDNDLDTLKELVNISNRRRNYVQEKQSEQKENTNKSEIATDTVLNPK